MVRTGTNSHVLPTDYCVGERVEKSSAVNKNHHQNGTERRRDDHKAPNMVEKYRPHLDKVCRHKDEHQAGSAVVLVAATRVVLRRPGLVSACSAQLGPDEDVGTCVGDKGEDVEDGEPLGKEPAGWVTDIGVAPVM